jgi:hypothetical protein
MCWKLSSQSKRTENKPRAQQDFCKAMVQGSSCGARDDGRRGWGPRGLPPAVNGGSGGLEVGQGVFCGLARWRRRWWWLVYDGWW